MAFWVLENTKHGYAKVHRADCGCCKDGKGPGSDHTGQWHGPFATYIEALAAAKNTKKRDIAPCKLCHPQLTSNKIHRKFKENP